MNVASPPLPTNPATLKACCAALYESRWVRLLLGDSFHPGGLALTGRLGQWLGLQPGMRLLDVAAGNGASAIYLAQTFGCQVVGLDLSQGAVAAARQAARQAGVGHLVRFEAGDAEGLPFPAGTFDALLCECAFCTFPDKVTAAGEFARVLRPGGRLGLSDLTRSGPLPASLQGLLAWIACIADAQPVEQLAAFLQGAGMALERVEAHDQALAEMVRQVQGRLLGTELLLKLKKVDLPGVDLGPARRMARVAADTVRAGTLGYALLLASKPERPGKRPAKVPAPL